MLMKINKNILVLSIIAVLVSALAVVAIVKAATGGALTPPPSAVDGSNNPQGTMHTLENIYQSIQTSPTWQNESTVIDGLGGLVWNANNCGDCSTQDPFCGCMDPTGHQTLLLGATEYCAYLEADGSTIDLTPQNYWRLPTEGELLKALSKGFIENSDGGGFQVNYSYWSSTPVTPVAGGPGFAWFANNYSGSVFSINYNMSSQVLVRCVH